MCDKHGGTPRFAVRSRHPVRYAGYPGAGGPKEEKEGHSARRDATIVRDGINGCGRCSVNLMGNDGEGEPVHLAGRRRNRR